MAIKSISWILDFTSKLKTRKEKVECLRANGAEPILMVLKYALDPNIKWLLPDSDPPYEVADPAEFGDLSGALYKEARKFYHYLEGGNPDLHQINRERMFIEMLSSIDAEDAKLMLAVKNKTIPYPGITAKLVNEAFPGLISGE